MTGLQPLAVSTAIVIFLVTVAVALKLGIDYGRQTHTHPLPACEHTEEWGGSIQAPLYK